MASGALSRGPSDKLVKAVNNHSRPGAPRVPNAVKLAARNGSMDPGYATNMPVGNPAPVTPHTGGPLRDHAALNNQAQAAASHAQREQAVQGWRDARQDWRAQQNPMPQQMQPQQPQFNPGQNIDPGYAMQQPFRPQGNPLNNMAMPRHLGIQFPQMPQAPQQTPLNVVNYRR